MDKNTEQDVGRDVEKTVEWPVPAEPETEELPGAERRGQAPLSSERPHLRDVTGVTGSYLHAKFDEFLAACRRHKGACAGLAVLAVIAVFALVGAFSHARNVPAVDFVEADARQRMAVPDYAPGDFGSTDTLYISEVSVGSRRRVMRTSDSSQAQFGASGYAEARVTATFSNGSVTATKTSTLSYAKVGSDWQAIGGEEDTDVSYEATAGIDRSRLLDEMAALYAKGDATLAAGASATSEAGTSQLALAEIYANSKVSVTDEEFDAEAQTDTVTLTCVKASSFESYTCKMVAHFAFRPVNGVWELDSLEINDDAKTRTFQPLVGTWEGTFQSQETDGAKCLGAGASPLSVTFEAAETADGDAGARLTGSISALAHFHEHPSADSAACDGDEALADVRLVANYYGGHNDDVDSDLAFVAALPEEVGGTVTVTFGFGAGGDPTQAVARVQTTYPHKGTFLFIPYDQTITYTDVYLLRKVS